MLRKKSDRKKKKLSPEAVFDYSHIISGYNYKREVSLTVDDNGKIKKSQICT